MTACRTLLRLLDPRRTALLLLPLFLTASLLGGGWYCADGAQCRPVAAATCCCEGHDAPADDHCCADKPQAERVTVADAACGCYYHSQSADAQLRGTGLTLLDCAYLLPFGGGVQVAAPGRGRTLRRPPAATISPPRYLRSPTDGRAPPLA